MRRDVLSSSIAQPERLTGYLLGALLWPVRLLLTLVELLFTEVVARVLALPEITWDAIRMHRQSARQLAHVKQEARLMRLQEKEASRIVRAPFIEGLRLIDEFDRRQAALDPRFLSSLQASRAICDAVTAAVPELVASEEMQQRLRDSLERLFITARD